MYKPIPTLIHNSSQPLLNHQFSTISKSIQSNHFAKRNVFESLGDINISGDGFRRRKIIVNQSKMLPLNFFNLSIKKNPIKECSEVAAQNQTPTFRQKTNKRKSINKAAEQLEEDKKIEQKKIEWISNKQKPKHYRNNTEHTNQISAKKSRLPPLIRYQQCE